MKLFGRDLSVAQLQERTGSLTQCGGFQPFVYSEGRSRGVRGLRLDTGAMQVEIVVDRCLDIAHVTTSGVPLMWRSANDIAAPEFYNPEGDEWLRSFFGGWLTTCGLSNFGPGGRDRWGSFGLHGRINNTPAESLAVSTQFIEGGCTFVVSGIMRETKALGEVMVLYRTISADLGGTTLRVRDRVVNEGNASSPHMLLYHCNAGWPLLDEATNVHVSHAAMKPRDAVAKAGLDVWDKGGLPQQRFDEQVFVHTMRACVDGKARAAVINPTLGSDGMGFELAFNANALPALMSWRMLEAKNYVMAIEPANTPAIQGRLFAEEHGMLPILEPGDDRHYEVDMTVLSGERLNASIAMIASATATTTSK